MARKCYIRGQDQQRYGKGLSLGRKYRRAFNSQIDNAYGRKVMYCSILWAGLKDHGSAIPRVVVQSLCSSTNEEVRLVGAKTSLEDIYSKIPKISNMGG